MKNNQALIRHIDDLEVSRRDDTFLLTVEIGNGSAVDALTVELTEDQTEQVQSKLSGLKIDWTSNGATTTPSRFPSKSFGGRRASGENYSPNGR